MRAFIQGIGVFLLLFVSTTLPAQRDYRVHFKSGPVVFPSNFDTQRSSPVVEEGFGRAVRYLQFSEVLTAAQLAQLQELEIEVLDYVTYATYLLALPAGLDLHRLEPLQPRSMVVPRVEWKMHHNLRERPFGAWAVQGTKVEVVAKTYAFIPIRIAAQLAASKGAILLETGNQNGYFRFQIEQDRLEEVAQWSFISWIELLPPPGQAEDFNGRSLHRANLLDSDHPLGKKYNGAGVNTLVRDDGAVGPHVDFKGRLFNQESTSPELSGTHGDGVAGIIGGAGNIDPTKKGMAAGADVYVIDYSASFQDETLPLFLNEQVTVTNTSYSDGCNDGYTLAAQTVDQQLFDHPTLMHVFSAGNSNGSDCGYGAGNQWGNITGGHKMSKNSIATANLNADGSLATSSSRGPATDGRLKPDIAAHGANQNSTNPNHAYQVFGGTSAAAPGIAGCLAQLTQAYRTLHNTSDAPSALLKIALLNTATDLGNVGPDYRFGWGHVNNYRALTLLEEGRYLSGNIAHAATQTHTVNVPSGLQQARLMLYWADPEAAVNAAKALVNDLDITVTGPNGTVYRPWKLNTAPNATLLNQPAGTGRDSLNNAEQVVLTNPASGAYTVTIKGFEVPQGPQAYYLAWEWIGQEIKMTYPAGGEAFVPGKTEWIRWDAHGNTDPFTLSYSTNGGQSFTTIGTAVNSARSLNWTVPNVTSGNVRLLIVRGTQRDTTDFPLTIAAVPTGLAVTRVCPDSVTLSWNPINNPSLAYDVFLLGEKYMELQTTTANGQGSATFPLSDPLVDNWFSVRAKGANGLEGLRANAIRWQGGLLGCPQDHDLALILLQSPLENNLLACEGISRPIAARVQNNGQLAAQGGSIRYKIDGSVIATEPLPTILPGAALDYTFSSPYTFTQNGLVQLQIEVLLAGDLLIGNNTLQKEIAVVATPSNQEVNEDFDASAQLPVGWSIVNPDNEVTWSFFGVVGSDGLPTRSLRVTHYTYSNPSNQQDYLTVIPLDLSGFTQPLLEFDYTHAAYSSEYSDGLRVELFDDCNFANPPVVLWQKFDPQLAVLTQTDPYIPTAANQWRKESVSLANYVGSTVFLRFTSINGYGNNTYLDNIRITDQVPPNASFTASATTGCAPMLVNYQSTSTGAQSLLWSFPGGTPSSSTASNPTVTYTNPGIYSASLTVSNSFGNDTQTQTDLVQVNTGPIAGFAVQINGATIQFQNNSTNSISYSWEFGDGSNSSLQAPSHTYAQDGSYLVRLIAQNACGADTSQQQVVIVTPPNADFAVSATSGCSPFTVVYTNTSSSNASGLSWSFPGGSPSSSTAVAPVVVYSSPGVYPATLQVSNAAGTDTEQKNNLITVSGLPDAGFSAQLSGWTATFSNQSLAATSFLWDFGDGQTSTQPNPVHTYAQNGTYTVQLTATNACGSDQFVQVLQLVALPVADFTSSGTNGCTPFTVSYQSTSLNASQYHWLFPGGNPSSSSLPNPVVVYAAPGTYSARLIASNAVGSDTLQMQNLVQVAASAQAEFTAQVNGMQVAFTNLSTGATQFTWLFGDGATTNLSSPVHTYTQNGTFTVRLIASNTCGADTFQQIITIQTPPVADFQVSTAVGCAPFTVQYQNLSSANATGFVWSFPGGIPATSTAVSPTVVYANAGVYNASLVASNTAGSSTKERLGLLQVEVGPSAGFSLQQAGASVVLNQQSTGALSYAWDFGDGSGSTQPNPTHTYTQDGSYWIQLISSNNCGSDTAGQWIVVFTPPSASITAVGTEGCVPLEVLFESNVSANAAGFIWHFPGGSPANSTEANPTVVYAQPGNYAASLEVFNSAGTVVVELADSIRVGALPVAAFSAQVNGLEVLFTNSSQQGVTYQWVFGDGASSQAVHPVHTYGSEGSYEVRLVVTSNCGGVDTFVQTITLVTPPLADFSVLQNEGCAPYQVVFQNNSTPNASQFEWQFPGGIPTTSTEAAPVVVYSAPGTYAVRLKAINAAGVHELERVDYISVNTIPSVAFEVDVLGGLVEFVNLSTNADSYLWDFGNGSSSTAENPSYTYPTDGWYSVQLTAANACGTASYSDTLLILVGSITDLSGAPLAIQVAPNPNQGAFSLVFSAVPGGEMQVALYSSMGQFVREDIIETEGSDRYGLNYSTLPAGVYYLRLRHSTGFAVLKLILLER
ncbi:MAG: PKD domain-containing protein [Chitinophagales bacterium]